MAYNAMTREERVAASNYVEGVIIHAQKYRNCPVQADFLQVIGGIPSFIARVQQVECCFGGAQEFSYSMVVRDGGAALTATPKVAK